MILILHFPWPFNDLLASGIKVRILCTLPSFVQLDMIMRELTRILTQFILPSRALVRRELTYSSWADMRCVNCAKTFARDTCKDATRKGEYTVTCVKFMLREATVLARALFPPWETVAMAIVRNASKRKKFYEIIVIFVNNR